VYYFNQKKSHWYRLYDDSLVLYLPEYNVALNDFNVKGDTLSFKNEFGEKYRELDLKIKTGTNNRIVLFKSLHLNLNRNFTK
jgi:hypothetical protein